MNKIIPTEDRVFMSLVGPTASGKCHFILQMLKKGTFVPPFEKKFLFSYFQKLYIEMQKEVSNVELIGSLDFDFIENLPNDGTKYLFFFEDSCDEISRSKQFEKIALAGRHWKLNCICIKHTLFQKSAQYTHSSVQVTTRCSTN